MFRIFVGNLNYQTDEQTVRDAFASFGEVASVKFITDRETGRFRGFGFVEMPNDEEGRRAVDQLDGSELDGRRINVDEAKPRDR
ncbi:MAG: RNA-binding protein [Planctomycetes bacterium]|nr:RNA-binding protein [Planctomycetota bacterium]